MKKIIIKNKERKIQEFINALQWDLRASYNSSSCLNEKQSDFLKEQLYDLLIVIEKEAK